MRNLFILIVLCLVGYWAYEHYFKVAPTAAPDLEQSTSGIQFAMPDPVAFKMKIFQANGPEIVEVNLIDGNRWRCELRKTGFSGVVVAVFDGSHLVSTNPSLTPAKGMGPAMRSIISSINGLEPTATEVRDGRPCWLYKGTPNPDGTRSDIWVDRETRFPVYTSGMVSGVYAEIHFELLKSDFSVLEKTCFETSNTDPMLTPFLIP